MQKKEGGFGWVPPAGNLNAAPTMLITYRLGGVEVKDVDSGLRDLSHGSYRLGVRLLSLLLPFLLLRCCSLLLAAPLDADRAGFANCTSCCWLPCLCTGRCHTATCF